MYYTELFFKIVIHGVLGLAICYAIGYAVATVFYLIASSMYALANSRAVNLVYAAFAADVPPLWLSVPRLILALFPYAFGVFLVGCIVIAVIVG
jgi:hypothetical protein